MRAFTGPLLASIRFPLPSVLRGDVRLPPRGEFLHDRNQHPIIPCIPHSTLLLFHYSPSSCFSPLSFFICLPAPRCRSLMFTYSPTKTTNRSFTARSLRAFLSHRSLSLLWMLFLLSLLGPYDFFLSAKKKEKMK